MSTKVVASIEARMSSSRFPGKVMADILGKPAIECLVDRLKLCNNLDDIIIATTNNSQDDVLVEWANNNKIHVFRGSEEDVLARVVGAHKSVNSQIIVEVTGDCVLLDPGLIDMGIDIYLSNKCDVVTNCGLGVSYPLGADIQIFSLDLLDNVEKNIFDPAVREHVSLYFYENIEKYNIINLVAPPRWNYPELRLQIDYVEDYEFVTTIFKHFEPVYGDNFGIEEIIQFVKKYPELLQINKDCIEKKPRIER
jgi:spore coat polysaccharide biosynthesis protein SpsF